MLFVTLLALGSAWAGIASQFALYRSFSGEGPSDALGLFSTTLLLPGTVVTAIDASTGNWQNYTYTGSGYTERQGSGESGYSGEYDGTINGGGSGGGDPSGGHGGGGGGGPAPPSGCYGAGCNVSGEVEIGPIGTHPH